EVRRFQSHSEVVTAAVVAEYGAPQPARPQARICRPWYALLPSIPAANVGGSRVEPFGNRVPVRTSTYGTPGGGLPRQAVSPLVCGPQAVRPGAVPQIAVTVVAPSFALTLAYR